MEGRQRVGALAELPQVLRDLGEDPQAVVSRAGIDPVRLRNPENSLSFDEFGRLIETCADATHCEHLGLLIGQRSGSNSLGLVGRLMQNAPTLGQAMLDLCTNQQRYVRGAVIYLMVQEETAFWGYAVYHPNARAIAHIGDAALAIGFNILKELVGAAPEAILTSRRLPRDLAPYRRVFGLLPSFDAEQHALIFPANLLSRPIQNADLALRQTLEKSVASYWAIEQPNVSQQVVRYVRARMMFGGTTRAGVAAYLSMHERALNRRLLAEGATFRGLLGEARFEVARQLLAGTRIDITQIALVLGYADVSAFSHAFQRWAGAAPSAWRDTGFIESRSALNCPPREIARLRSG